MVVSLAVFGPQSRSPHAEYLESIRCFVVQHPILQTLVQDIHTLREVWDLLANNNLLVKGLANGPLYADLLIDWLTSGGSDAVASAHSGAVALPRLAIIQMAQYFHFLQSQEKTHAELVAEVQSAGSFQGYCGGLPAASALSSATDERQLRMQMISAVRIAYAIGIYAELGDDPAIPGSTTIVVRLKDGCRAEDIVEEFPGTYVSAVTDPKSISIVGPVQQIRRLHEYVTNRGMLAQYMDIRGKTHNPENEALAAELGVLCDKSPSLFTFPSAERLVLSLRSNVTGEVMVSGSLNKEIVQTILASQCQWYRLLSNVALDFKQVQRDSHSVMSFGIGDCVALMPFNKLGLTVQKTDWGNQSMMKSPRNIQNVSDGEYEYPENSIAIIGASCRLPGANNMEELWQMMSKGEDRHEEVKASRLDIHGAYRATQGGTFTRGRRFYGNFIEDLQQFDNAFFGINPREMANMDPQQRLLLQLAYEAMECSGYTKSHDRSRADNIGCFVGASFVEYLENTSSHPPTAYTSTSTIRAFLCGRISYHFGWIGPSEVVDTACSSSLVAINRAIKAIQGGECSVALAGGVNLITGVNNFLDLGKAGFLSPTGQCKPFDEHADGYCRADGAGLVVLKTLEQARKDGDHIMAVIPGAATNQGGQSSGITVPDPNALCRLYTSVLTQAKISAETVTYVETHGTGTQVGDPLELASIQSVFGNKQRANTLYFGSLKGNIGHCETAAGVAGLLKVLCMLKHGKIPPQASHKVWNPNIPSVMASRMVLPDMETPWLAPMRVALVNSYGAAGSNAALLCCEPPCTPMLPQSICESRHEALYPVILSAKSPESLSQYTELLAKHLLNVDPSPTLAQISYSLSERRSRHKYRTVLQSRNIDELVEKLSASVNTGLDIPFETRPTVLIFGGQSKTTIGLPREVYDQYSTLREHVGLCDSVLQSLGFPSIMTAIFETEAVSDIVLLQTAFVAVQYAFAMTWLQAGLGVDVVIGHSLGELTALAVSGVLSIQDCLKLVAARAVLMKSKWGEDKGSMLAVFANSHVVREVISALRQPKLVEVACFNSETCQVVSGSTLAIRELEDIVKKEHPHIRVARIETSNGFHSHLVDPILDNLQQFGQSLSWKEPRIPIELCTECPWFPGSTYDPSKHAREPVYFAHAIKRIEDRHGPCNWLEAGINTPITSMTKRATSALIDHRYLSLSSNSVGDWTDAISDIICSLWSLSVDITHWQFLSKANIPTPIWLPPYQFGSARGWLNNIDHAAVLHGKLLHSTNTPSERVHKDVAPAKLVARIHAGQQEGETKFEILVEGNRFQSIVKGHSVRQQPLCPASMYLECVTMAFELLLGNVVPTTRIYEELNIQAPVGLDTKNLLVTLRPNAKNHGYQFTIRSTDSTGDQTLHADGRVKEDAAFRLDMFGQVMHKQIQFVRHDSQGERFLNFRAYKMFSRVVNYSPILKGISRITMTANESVADIDIPPNQPGLEETTVIASCDTVTLDNFLQVLGLLVNSSHIVNDDEVMVCNGIDQTVITSTCNMKILKSWVVYACYRQTEKGQIVGDVFALDSNGLVVAAITSCRFVKLAVGRLEKRLASVNSAVSKLPSLTNNNPEAASTLSNGFSVAGTHDTVDNSDMTMSDHSVDTAEVFTPLSEPQSLGIIDKILNLIAETTGMPTASITEDATLGALGMDSLALTETLSALSEMLQLPIPANDISLQSTVHSLLKLSARQECGEPYANQYGQRQDSPSKNTLDPVAGLRAYEGAFSDAANQHGYIQYWVDVEPQQRQLAAIYIIEAFEELGTDISFAKPQVTLKNPMANHPRHTALVPRLWDILEATGYIQLSGNGVRERTTKPGPKIHSSQFHTELVQKFPKYAVEMNLLSTCGPKLAECLRGDVDPVKLLFGSSVSAHLLETFYRTSPMLATATSQLVAFILKSIENFNRKDKIRILEVGAGTGGTTFLLVSSLQNDGHQVEYIFTDISTSLVARAKRRFSQYHWMTFQKFDLEHPSEFAVQEPFDIILGTNCVHATSNRIATLRNLRKLLAPAGLLVLSEVTKRIFWYDLVFGLFDGWCSSEDGSSYPLQSPETWETEFREAGFSNVLRSQGRCKDSNTQHLLVGCNTTLIPTPSDYSVISSDFLFDRTSAVYKEVDGVSIEADIYFPVRPNQCPMPIALMLHGGGHLTLSRRMIRPCQTEYLLQNGVLPISLDYRLCPEVSLMDGAMTDVRDAFFWVRNDLATICKDRGIKVDVDKVLVIGWSSGGHLAMSTAWTVPKAGLPPPVSILSFYSPTNFSRADSFPRHKTAIVPRKIGRDKLLSQVLSGPAKTSHDLHGQEECNLGWVKSGDWRSELLSSLFHESAEFGLSLLLNGRLELSQTIADVVAKAPNREEVQAICPTSQVRMGQYRVPTCIVHGDLDDIARYDLASQFCEELRCAGVASMFLPVPEGRHVFDLQLRPGMHGWDKYVLPAYKFITSFLGH